MSESLQEVFAKNSQESRAVVQTRLPRVSAEEILDLMQNASLKELGECAFKIKKQLHPDNITTFVDCFCGGANLADKIICDNIYAIDLSPTLISLHKAAQEDFSLIPEDCDREKWDSAYAAWKRMKKK